MSNLPLAGIKVVEFSHMVMGPTAGMILADLGADVIKIEPVGGDKTRNLPGSGAGYFPMYNRNKRSMVVDLKAPDARKAVLSVLANADVVLENFKPGFLEKFDLGFERLAEHNPQLVMCTMKGFQAGPYENRLALDEVVQMMGGLAYMTGPPGQPLRAGASVNDVMGGMFAALGIIASIRQREMTGVGGVVTSSLFENNVFLVGQHIAQYAVTGKPAAPMPARSSAWAIYNTFATSDDDMMFLAVVSDSQFAAFCQGFELEELRNDTRFITNISRVKNREPLLRVVRHRMLDLTKQEIAEIAESAGIPFAAISRPEDLPNDPHLNVPGAMLPVTIEDGKSVSLPALPIALDGRRLPLRRDLPTAGEHSIEILREAGVAETLIESLVSSGAVEQGEPRAASVS